jgi:hypothetical protein
MRIMDRVVATAARRRLAPSIVDLLYRLDRLVPSLLPHAGRAMAV